MDDMRECVKGAFEILLGRSPDGDAVFDMFSAYGSAVDIFRAVGSSHEFRTRLQGHPFYHYGHLFDPEAVIARHRRHDLVADPRYFTNFLGVKMEPRYLPHMLADRAGKLDDVPIPANWHADMAEWGAALRAVDLATHSFTVLEVGCGWGCWINNTGVAARNRRMFPILIGVEGDPGHIAFARDCCALNGFSREQVELHHGIAAARGGVALFPKQSTAGENWGLEPVFDADENQRRAAVESGRFDELPMVPLDSVVGRHKRVDLLHVDIQGGEADLVEQNMDLLGRHMAYLVIGTHSRALEGRLVAALTGGGWRLEIERPAIVQLTPEGPVIRIDGVQGWRNMTLLPD